MTTEEIDTTYKSRQLVEAMVLRCINDTGCARPIAERAVSSAALQYSKKADPKHTDQQILEWGESFVGYVLGYAHALIDIAQRKSVKYMVGHLNLAPTGPIEASINVGIRDPITTDVIDTVVSKAREIAKKTEHTGDPEDTRNRYELINIIMALFAFSLLSTECNECGEENRPLLCAACEETANESEDEA